MLNFDRSLDQLNLIYNTYISEYVKPEIKPKSKSRTSRINVKKSKEVDRTKLRDAYALMRE